MAHAAAIQTEFANVAELLKFLGDIPANRIRMRPTPGQATEEDLLEVQAREGRICELIDGVLVEKETATFESRLAAVLIFYIETFLEGKNLGAVLAGDGLLRLFLGRIRAPDVSFISWKQMRGRVFPRERIASLSPALAVEILSEGNTGAEMKRKLKEYFQSGSRLVWYVDPNARTVQVYTKPRKSILLAEDQSPDGGSVLPGYSLSIRGWFERATGEGIS